MEKIIFLSSILLSLISIYILFSVINRITNCTTKYLNDLHLVTQAQLKSELNRNYRYSLIKNLKDMKKYIGISLVAIILGLLIAGGIIFNDSRNYFIEYFDVKRQKLDLMHESSVDSLKSVIILQTKVSDSLMVKLNSNQEIIESLNKQLEAVNKSNANLQYNIRTQNQMIEKLVKENSELKNK